MKSPFASTLRQYFHSYKRVGTLVVAFVGIAALASAFFYIRAHAATTYTWNQTGTASWATSTNWTPTRTTPVADDILIFNNGATTTVTNVPTETIGQLLVSLNTTVNLQAAAAVTLTVAGGGGSDLDVQAGSALNCNTTNAITIAVGTGATGSIFGSMTFSAGASTDHRLTSADASGITFNTGATFTAGTNFSGNAFGTAPLNTIVFAGGSTYVFNAGGSPFGASAPNSVVVFLSGSTYRHQSPITPAPSGRTYSNFEVNLPGQTVTVTGISAFVCDNLTVTAGTFLNYAMTGTPGHSIKGNISVAGTLDFVPMNPGTVNLNGTSAQTISGSGAIQTNSNQTLNLANASGLTLLRNFASTGPFTVSSGTFNTAANIVSGTGTFTLSSGATLGIGNANGIVSPPVASGSIQSLNRNFSSSANYTYNGGIAQVTGNGLPSTVNNLTINNSAGVALTNNATVNGTLTLTSGNATTSTNTLAVASAGTVSRTSGHVIGNLQKAFAATGSKSFEVGTANGYSPVAVNATAGTFPANFTVKAIESSMPGISGTNKLARYWTLTNTTITNANLTFNYLAGDVTGTVANYQFIKNSGGTLSTLAPTGTPTSTSATINGVTSFSDWTLAEPSAVQSGTLQFSAANYDSPETNADHDVTITVTRTGGSNGAVDVNFGTSNGTATTADNDYVTNSGTLHWNDGDATSKTFIVNVKGDTTYEAHETVNLTLSNPQGGATIGATNPATLRITNSDPVPGATTFGVNANDDNDFGACVGHCSLREAINAANENGDSTPIHFAIGSGQQTISLTSQLPEITSPVTLDATTQPGWTGSPIIELDGTNAGVPDKIGIRLTTSSSTIKGLVINSFSFYGMQIFGSSNLIQGNYIGTNVAGTAGLGNGFDGIRMIGSNNTIGGTTAAARNLISGNGALSFSAGIGLQDCAGTIIQGNYIGTNAAGTAAIANNGEGVTVTGSSSSTTIGGGAAGEGNLISGNTGDGVSAFNSGGGTSVKGNKIGTQADGVSALGNSFQGVKLFTSGNSVGGTGAGEGNIIAFNSQEGVAVVNNSTQNSIRRNSIFSNTALGIDLGAFTLGNGVTPNDNQDPDTGPNNRQNFPVITAATPGGPGTITGTLNTTPSSASGYAIDFFKNTACNAVAPNNYGEGATYLGSVTTGNTDGSGDVGFTFNPATLNLGDVITATATDVNGNTSEFSACFTVAFPDITFNASGNLSAGTYNNVTINSPAVVTMTGDVVVNGCVNVNSGATLNMGTFTFTGPGCFTLNSGATFGIGSAAGINSGATGNVQVGGARSFSTGANYVYNGSTNQVVGNQLPAFVINLSIANTGPGGSNTVTGNPGQTVGGLLRVQSGIYAGASTYSNVQIDSGATLAGGAGNTNNVTGSWTNNGMFTGGTSTVVFNGSINPQTIGGSSNTSFSNLTISNGAGVNLLSDQTVNGTLTISSGAFRVGSTTITLNGPVAGPSGFSSNVDGTVIYNQQSNGQGVLDSINGPYGNVTFSNFNKTFNVSGFGLTGTFTPGTATGHTLSNSSINFVGAGAQSIPAFAYYGLSVSGSGRAMTLASSGVIKIAGTFTAGTNNYVTTGSTIEYNGTAAQSLPSAFTPYNNLTLNNAAGTSGFAGLAVNGLLRVQSGTFTSASDYHNVTIDSGATLALSGAITVSGNWTNNGTFTHNTHAVTFDGTTNQSSGGSSTTDFATLNISNTGTSPTNVVSLQQTISDSQINITAGVLDQVNANVSSGPILISSGATFRNSGIFNLTSGAVIVSSGATWSNTGTGDVTLSGNVSNSGTINFNANGTSCGETDDILLRSSNATQRIWSGAGTFLLVDVDVAGQTTPLVPPPAFILVRSGFNSGNNGAGWVFDSNCLSGTYTWIGNTPGVNTDWQVPTNWTPTRTTPNAADILLFDGGVTPGPIVTNVPTQTIAALRLTNGVNGVTLNASGTNTLSLVGSAGPLSVPAGTLLTLSGGNALTISVNGTGPSSIGGQIIMQDGAHRLIGAIASELTFASGSIFTTSTGFTGNPFGTGTNGSVIFASGSSAFFNAGLSPFGGSGNSVVTFDSGSTQTFNASSAFSSDGRTYGHLTLTGGQSYAGTGSGQMTISNNLTIRMGSTLTLSSTAGGDLNLLGNFENQNTITGKFDPNNRTVKFQGGGTTQTIHSASGSDSFFDVFIAETAGGKVQLQNALTITGQLNLSTADSVIEFNGGSLLLNGTVIGPGGLRGDFLGSGLQIGGTGALGTLRFVSGGEMLHSLNVNRTSSGSVDLGSNLTIGDGSLGGLTLVNGVINTGANTLTHNAPGGSRTNGYVIGNLQRNFNCTTSCSITFHVGTANGYSPVSETVYVISNGTYSQTVKAVQAQHPNISGVNALQRYWTLTAPSGSGTASADVTFNYLAGDVVGNETLYKIFKYNAGFTQFTPDVLNTTSHFATLNGVSSFSDWTLAEPGSVNPSSLGNYPATSVDLSGNTTVPPDAVPTNTTSINVSTSTNFKGKLEGDPATGIVRVTDAHPGGTYPISVTAFNSGTGPTTKTFTLTVTDGTACNGNTSFTNAADVGVGSNPVLVAIGDFNGDGKQDIAATNFALTTVSIRLGDGLGGFTSATDVSVGQSPASVAIGDFNNDGKQDIAAANISSNTVSIRLGDGLGGFSGTTNVGVGSAPRSVAIGDFNGDGKQDFAAANSNGPNTVSIRLGDGLGGFSGTTNVSVGSVPVSVAIGDFNIDGKQDIAVANQSSNTVSIRLGDDLGGFSGTTDVSVDSGPFSVAVGDFNNDGKQDIAAANFGSTTVSIRLGDGLGGFSGTTNVSVGIHPRSVAIGDFNNDGKQDIAAANRDSNTVSIRLGDGLGGFSGTTNVSVGSVPVSVAIGDFNNDGKQDIAAANNGSNNLSVRLGGCTPVVNLSVSTSAGSEAAATVVTVTATASDPVVGPQTVSLGVSGTNITAGDYTLSNSTITILNGATTGSVTFTVVNDSVYEGTETATLTISTPSSGIALGATTTQNVTITDNDAPPSFTIDDVTHDEGNSLTTSYVFTVTKTGSTEVNASVQFQTVDGSATLADNDYQTNSGTLNFTPAQTTQQITVLVNGDTTNEPDEVFTVHLFNALDATITDADGTGTITNDDIVATISGRVTYANGTTPGKNVTMTLTSTGGIERQTTTSTGGVFTQTTTTDANGDYSFIGVPVGSDYTLTPSKAGDVNGIESLDASNVARYVAGLDIPTANQRIAADADGDTILTSLDAALIARRVAGLPGFGIVGTWKFVPVNRTYLALGADQTGQNFTAILVGDTSGNWIPAIPSGGGDDSAVSGSAPQSSNSNLPKLGDLSFGLVHPFIKDPSGWKACCVQSSASWPLPLTLLANSNNFSAFMVSARSY
jgi:CSLREA domain-containing protein